MKRIYSIASLAIVIAVATACGGRQTIASKSAAAYRDAVARGIPVGAGGHIHGGHLHVENPAATESSGDTGMANMDHGAMPGMDMSEHRPNGATPSAPKNGATGMANMKGMAGMGPGMDHPKMQREPMAGMKGMAGMQHGSMPGMPGMKMPAKSSMENMPGMRQGQMGGTMDHQKMQREPMSGMKGMAGTQQGSMPGMPGMKMPATSSMENMPGMRQGQMGGMSGMQGMQHGGAQMPSVLLAAPVTSSGMAQLSPASTLQQDSVDQAADGAAETKQHDPSKMPGMHTPSPIHDHGEEKKQP